jgi:hypothetical protein
MKNQRLFILTVILLFFINKLSYAQSIIDDKQAVQMLKEFYTAHGNTAYSSKGLHKLDSLKKQYCSLNFRKKLSAEFKAHGLDHDLMTNDYGIDKKALNSLKITKIPYKVNIYQVIYNIDTTNGGKPIIQKVLLKVKVILENGGLKISSVE